MTIADICRPLRTGLPLTLALTGLGGFLGYQFREWRARTNAEEMAVLRHYIMTHPEEFPEPEKKFFREKEVFWPFKIAR